MKAHKQKVLRTAAKALLNDAYYGGNGGIRVLQHRWYNTGRHGVRTAVIVDPQSRLRTALGGAVIATKHPSKQLVLLHAGPEDMTRAVSNKYNEILQVCGYTRHRICKRNHSWWVCDQTGLLKRGDDELYEWKPITVVGPDHDEALAERTKLVLLGCQEGPDVLAVWGAQYVANLS